MGTPIVAPETHGFRWPEGVARDALASVYTVPPERAGMRLDRFLVACMPRLSRTRAANIAKSFAYTAEGRRLDAAARTQAGMVVVLFRPAWEEPADASALRVLYEDEVLVAVDKPAGLAVHPTANAHNHTLLAQLRARYPGEPIGLAHRLDKETSGVVLAARRLDAEVKLKQDFASRSVHKVYLAVAYGVPSEERFVVDAPLGLADSVVRVRMEVKPESQGGQAARTRVTVLEALGAYSLLQCEPETGRQHQIRVHLAHAGHPLVGDKLYAHGEELFLRAQREGMSDELRAMLLLERQALHAHRITVEHPTRHEALTLEAPLAADLSAFAEAQRARSG